MFDLSTNGIDELFSGFFNGPVRIDFEVQKKALENAICQKKRFILKEYIHSLFVVFKDWLVLLFVIADLSSLNWGAFDDIAEFWGWALMIESLAEENSKNLLRWLSQGKEEGQN